MKASDKKAAAPNAAFQIGIYDRANPNLNAFITKSVKDLSSCEYSTYDLGIVKQGYIWIAPCSNPDVNAIYVDRIFFVKDKKSSKAD